MRGLDVSAGVQVGDGPAMRRMRSWLRPVRPEPVEGALHDLLPCRVQQAVFPDHGRGHIGVAADSGAREAALLDIPGGVDPLRGPPPRTPASPCGAWPRTPPTAPRYAYRCGPAAGRKSDAYTFHLLGRTRQTMDGNNAAAHVSYAFTEVAAIYPITPSSPMADLSTSGPPRAEEHLRHPVKVVEMQSEAGAAGAVHGSLARRRPDHHLHRLPGPAADDPQHVQDRRRAAARRVPCLRPYRGHPRAEHLRRPLRRHGLPPDRLCHAGEGNVQEVMDLAPWPIWPPSGPRPLPQLLRRLPHLPRDPEDRRLGLRRPEGDVRHGRRGRVPRAP